MRQARRTTITVRRTAPANSKYRARPVASKLSRIGVSVMACPRSCQQRCRNLAAGHEANNKSAQAESLMHVKREHRHGDPDDQVRDEDERDDWQQRRH